MRTDAARQIGVVSETGKFYLAGKRRKTAAALSFSGEQPRRPGGVLSYGSRGKSGGGFWGLYGRIKGNKSRKKRRGNRLRFDLIFGARFGQRLEMIC